jgi:outer membrane protein TolC
MAAEPERAAEQEKQPGEREEYEEGIMIRALDLLHFQDTLLDIQSQIVDLQRDARQDRLEVQEMFRAIMDRLPPPAGPSTPPPAP